MSDVAHIYVGDVVHKRLRPTTHALRYGVFSLLIDVDRIHAITRRTRLLSYNRFNLFSIYDRDYGARDGVAIVDTVRRRLTDAKRPVTDRRITLLTYPRVLGYVFNPLSVYFVYAPGGELESLVYEVSNTFGERVSYVLAAGAVSNGVYAQACAKEMFVSPFAEGHGRYAFRVIAPGDAALVAVLFSDHDGALIKTHFRGTQLPLDDRTLLRLALRFPLLTVKVISAIHWEALKLWLKGVPLVPRHSSPATASIEPSLQTPAKEKG